MGGKLRFHASKGIMLRGLMLLGGLAVVLLLIYLSLSHAFRPAPTVQILPQNKYDDTLHVVTDIDYAPFSYVDENGEYAGLDVELINEIANRLHMNLDFTLMDWNDANAVIGRGEADIIMNMETDLITPDSGLISTIPTTEKQYVVYGRNSVDSVIDLFGSNVASLHQLPALELDITYINSYQQIFEGLRDGRFDYAICPIQVGNYFLEKLSLQDVHPSYAVGHVYGALALPSDRASLRDRLNLVLKELHEEGFLDSLDQKWVNHRYEYSSVTSIIQNHPVLATALLAGMMLFAVILFLLVLTQRRNAKVRERATKQLQEQLQIIQEARRKAYTDDLTGTHNKNAYQEFAAGIQREIDEQHIEPFAVVVCDVNNLKKINDQQGHKAGDRLIQDACEILRGIFHPDSIYRIGGDEFVAILQADEYVHRQELVEKLKHISVLNAKNGGIVIACGMSSYENDERAAAVFERADLAMYRDKAYLKAQE